MAVGNREVKFTIILTVRPNTARTGITELSFPRTFAAGSESSIGGTFVPRNFRSLVLSLPETFVPWNFRSHTRITFIYMIG